MLKKEKLLSYQAKVVLKYSLFFIPFGLFLFVILIFFGYEIGEYLKNKSPEYLGFFVFLVALILSLSVTLPPLVFFYFYSGKVMEDASLFYKRATVILGIRGESTQVGMPGNFTIPEFSRLLSLLQEISSELSEKYHEMERSERKFRSIFENAAEGIYQMNCDGLFMNVNMSMAKMLGYESPGELILNLNTKSHEFYVFEDEGAQFLEKLKKQKKVQNFIIQLYRKDKAMIWASINAVAVREWGDKLSYIEAIVNDITKSKLAEDNIDQMFAYQLDLTHSYSRFVPSKFLELLGHKNIIEVKLGDSISREMTVMFSDIRSFTTLSEAMMPEDNFKFLNSYLKYVGPVIEEWNGIIDKYIGDSIMALFPTDCDDALNASLQLFVKVNEFNDSRTAKGFSPIKIGVGMHVGDVILGTVGEESRMETTVISDTVNISSRLEGLTKVFGAQIVISQQFLEKITPSDRYKTRFLGKIQVKGKRKVINIYEVIQISSEFAKAKIDSIPLFAQAMELYYNAHFEAASKCFEHLYSINNCDNAAIYYHAKCLQYGKYGVPSDWTGVEIMDSK